MIEHRRREAELGIAEHQARTLEVRIFLSNREATPKQNWPPTQWEEPRHQSDVYDEQVEKALNKKFVWTKMRVCFENQRRRRSRRARFAACWMIERPEHYDPRRLPFMAEGVEELG
jgi:hypothetical protein